MGPRRPSRRTWLVGGLLTVLVTVLVVMSATAIAWGNSLRGEGRLLPGTTIASVDVGDHTVDEAVAAVGARLDARLDDDLTLVYGDLRWTVTPRDLGVSTDVDAVVAEARARTDAAGFGDLVRLRWFGGSAGPGTEIALAVPAEAADDFVANLADELDRGPRDAEVTLEDGTFVVAEDRAGREVRRDEAAAAITAAVAAGEASLDLPVTRLAPAVDTELAETVAAEAGAALEAALDRTVTVALEGDQRTVSPREVGASAGADVVEVAFAHHDTGGLAAADVALEVPSEGVAGLLEDLAAGKTEAARDAELDLSDGFTVTPERNGRTLDRDDAATKVRAALAAGTERVDLELSTVRPRITAESFDRVLVVRQSERVLELWRGGQVSRSWPVAVGTGDHPTPTGTFTIGAKRFEPTWVNPSPTGWGSSMPASIGPGPDNPLGLRALNWNDANGADTLIRFHGTPNEGSIGEAASKGCIRMYNADIIDLYDIVPSGTPIVSLS